jgi:hypothetical protein
MKKHPLSYICALIIVSLILTSFVGVIPANTQPGANLPCRTYGTNSSERAYALVQSSDFGYVLAGWTTAFPTAPNDTNVLIIRIDSAGNLVGPAKISVGLNAEEARSMVRTTDNGYAVTGWTRSYNGLGMGGSDIFVLKLDANLNLQWGSVYGGLEDDQAYSIIQTSDGGYALTGWTNSSGDPPFPNIIVMKLSQNGNVQWTRAYARNVTQHIDEGYGITEIPGGYAVVGRFHCRYYPDWDGFLMYLDTLGNLLGTEVLYGPEDDEAYSVTFDGHIEVAGWTKSYGAGDADIFVAKFPPTPGSPIWSNVYGWVGYDEKVMDDKSLIVTNDGNYAVSGWTYSMGPGAPLNPNFLIMKLDSSNGSVIWSRVHPSIPGNNSEEAYPMIQTANGGYAIAGWTNSFGLGGDDFHFLTLDQNGNRPVCVLDLAPPIDTCDWMNESMQMWDAYPNTTLMPLENATVQSVSVCTPPAPPFTQGLYLGQSDRVSASGNVNFTYNGTVIGGPYNVSCVSNISSYAFVLPREPNDISWNITINWSGACGNSTHNAELWTGTNQPWPATYTKTHRHSPEEWEVSIWGPPPSGVGGIAELPGIEEPGAVTPDSSGHNYGALAGIIVGAIVGVIMLISAAWYIRRRRTKAI